MNLTNRVIADKGHIGHEDEQDILRRLNHSVGYTKEMREAHAAGLIHHSIHVGHHNRHELIDIVLHHLDPSRQIEGAVKAEGHDIRIPSYQESFMRQAPLGVSPQYRI
jgi:hypothetical protein